MEKLCRTSANLAYICGFEQALKSHNKLSGYLDYIANNTNTFATRDMFVWSVKIIWSIRADEQTGGIPKFIDSFYLNSYDNYEVIEPSISLSHL